MEKVTIEKKMGGTGNIHDIASDLTDREINFRAGTKYAVVLAAYYGEKGYTTHKTAKTAIAAARKMSNIDYSFEIIDRYGHRYDVHNGKLVRDL